MSATPWAVHKRRSLFQDCTNTPATPTTLSARTHTLCALRCPPQDLPSRISIAATSQNQHKTMKNKLHIPFSAFDLNLLPSSPSSHWTSPLDLTFMGTSTIDARECSGRLREFPFSHEFNLTSFSQLSGDNFPAIKTTFNCD